MFNDIYYTEEYLSLYFKISFLYDIKINIFISIFNEERILDAASIKMFTYLIIDAINVYSLNIHHYVTR